MRPLASSTLKTPSRCFRGRAGFSLMELIAMIAIMAVIFGIGVSLLSGNTGSSRTAKMESDVSTLNQMVALYIADGGTLNGLTSPQSVLDKMKRVRPQSEWQQHAGAVSGRLVDVRLSALMTSTPNADDSARATWNRKTQRFELTQGGGTAVAQFYLDESLADADYGTEKRTKSTKTFNASSQGWVWGASTKDPQANYLNPPPLAATTPAPSFDPNESAPNSPTPDLGDTGTGGGGGGGGGTGGGSGGSAAAVTLPTPTISPPGGTFAFSSFPTSVTLGSNGAPPSASKLMYQINSGPWTEYAGETITLAPAMRIQARNDTTEPTEYSNSSTNTQTYYRLADGFTGTGTGTWGGATGGPNLVTNYENGTDTATFKHGETKLDLGNGEYLDAGVENVLSFTRASFDTITPNTWFKFGDMTLLNGTTFYDSEATQVSLTVNLNMSQPALDFTSTIDFGLTSTENTSDRTASADIVELKTPTTDVRITIDGVEYRLELSWANLDPGSGFVQGNKFYIYEGAAATAELRARFTSNH